MAPRSGTSRPLRVAVVHSFYSSSQPSGENLVVDQQVDALRRAGHEVLLVDQRTDDREQLRLYPVRAAVAVATGRGHDPTAELDAFAPDVVHVHNLFPNFGRRWLAAWTGPVVATVHNFRPLCAAATLYRDGHVCLDCPRAGSNRPAVQHGCYRGSRLATLPVAMSVRFDDDPLLRRADRVVTLSPVMTDTYVDAGVDAGKVACMPNFLPTPSAVGAGGDGWVYVGRLSDEKGVAQLLDAWPDGVPLDVVGDGPLRERLQQRAPSGVRLHGARPRSEAIDLLSRAKGLVFPSRWLEGFPMVYLEALAVGTPVLAWEPSSVAHLVRQDGTGLVVTDLREALAAADRSFPDLRDRCARVFESRYTEARWVQAIESLYTEIVER